jgi:hypothetical protein
VERRDLQKGLVFGCSVEFGFLNCDLMAVTVHLLIFHLDSVWEDAGTTQMKTMKALRFERYGPPSVLSIQELPVPDLKT